MKASARTPGSRAKATLIISVALLLLCGGLLLMLLESYPAHAWRSRTRTNTVVAVDSQTSQMLPIDLEPSDEVDDPFIVWSSTQRTPYKIEVTWNVSLLMVVKSNGFEERTVQLTSASPAQIVVSVARSKPIAATQPK